MSNFNVNIVINEKIFMNSWEYEFEIIVVY